MKILLTIALRRLSEWVYFRRNLYGTNMRLFIALTLLTLSACAPSPATQNPASDPHDVQATAPGRASCQSTTAQTNATSAAATNRLRQARGLAPVSPNPVLAKAAAQHACDMAQRGLMSHRGTRTTGPAQRVKALGYRPTITAENIAAGPFSLQRVLNEWNRSAGHRDNILISQMSEVGIGSALGADGKTMFWAAVYSDPK